MLAALYIFWIAEMNTSRDTGYVDHAADHINRP